MKTLFAKGGRYPYTNAGGSAVNPGDVVVLNSGATGFLGISVGTIAASGGTGDLVIGGPDECVHTLSKNSGEAFTDGQLIYWDATNKRLTGHSTNNTRAGRAFGPAATAATSANVILNQP